MVLEGLTSSLLSYFLSKYIDKINAKDLKMSLFSGKVALTQLSIKQSALMEHNIPFKVERGIINSLSAQIPYMKLKSSPCKTEINDIFILGTLCGQVLIQSDENARNSTEIPTEYSQLDTALQDQNVSKGDFTTGVVGSIIDNLQVKITNIHVRLETSSSGRTVAIGILIPLIKICTIDENDREVEVNTSQTMLRKKLILSNFSIYVDTNANSITNQIRNQNLNFQQVMQELFSSNHQFILHNFSIEAIYEHSKCENTPNQFGHLISITASAINLALDALQYRCFNELQIEQTRFNRRRFYAVCCRPYDYPKTDKDIDDCKLWWRFIDRCAIKKKYPISFNVRTALTFLKHRKDHLAPLSKILTNPNPKKDELYLKNLQQEFGGDVFLLFRGYAKMVTEKRLYQEKRKNSNEVIIQSNELAEIVSQKDMIKNNADTLGLKFNIKELDIEISYNAKTPLALLQWKDLEGFLQKNKDDVNIAASIGDVGLFNQRSNQKISILTLNKSKLTKGKCAYLELNGNLIKQKYTANVNAASPQFLADFSMINDIALFFSSSSDIVYEESAPKVQKRDMTNPEIVGAIENHKTMFLTLHIDTPIINIPYAKMPITVALGNIDISTIDPDIPRSLEDPNSWYDHFSLGINGFDVKLNDKSICKPINFSLHLYQSFIRHNTIAMTKVFVNITSVDFQINQIQYLSLLQFPEYLADMNSSTTPPQPMPLAYENKQNTEIVSNKQSNSFDNLSFSFDFTFDFLGLQLLNPDESIGSEINIGRISANVAALQSHINGKFSLQSVQILANEKTEICNFGNENEAAALIDFDMNGININANLETARPIITVDINWINQLLEFIKPPQLTPEEIEKKHEKQLFLVEQEMRQRRYSKIQSGISTSIFIFAEKKDFNDYQLKRTLLTHPIIKINVKCIAPEIIIPYDGKMFSANLGSLHVYTDDPIKRDLNNIDSFYDRFNIDFENFELKFGQNSIIDPFSTTIKLHKAFITRKDVQALKAEISIHKLNIQIKRSYFLSLLGLIESFNQINFNTQTDQPQLKQIDPEMESTATNFAGIENVILDSDNSFSVLTNLTFETFQIKLLNEDNSVHSSFLMNSLSTHLYMLQKDVDAKIEIVTLAVASREGTLISFGEEDKSSLKCSLSMRKDLIDVNCSIPKPTIIVDFRWIYQMKQYFEMPRNHANHANQITYNSQYTNANENAFISGNNLNDNDNTNQLVDNDKNKAIDKFKQNDDVKKIKLNFSMTQPSFTMILVTKKKDTITMNAGLNDINAIIKDDQTGSVSIKGLQISVDGRYLMAPFSILLDLALQPKLSMKLNLPEIALNLQTIDYQLLLEIGSYIPAVLFEAQYETTEQPDTYSSTRPRINSTPNPPDINSNTQNKPNTDSDVIENNEKNSIELDLKIGKVCLNIFDKEKQLFNFDINEILLYSTETNQICIELSSMVCQEHVSCSCNNLIILPTATKIQIDDSILIQISEDAKIFVKMAAINALLLIFTPKEQILDYTKSTQKVKKVVQEDDFVEIKQKPSLSIESKCLTIPILDETEILTVYLTGLSYQMFKKSQIISLRGLSIQDPIKSDLYPSEIIKNPKDTAIVVELTSKLTMIDITSLAIFANYNAIKRILDIVTDNPLQLNQTSNESAQNSEPDAQSNQNQTIQNENANTNEINQINPNAHDDMKNDSVITIKFHQIRLIVPVLLGISNEMLDLDLDGEVNLSSSVKLNLNSLSVRFSQYHGSAHPPFIKNLSFVLTEASNIFALSSLPSTISIAPDDIAAINVLVDSLKKFVSSLRFSTKTQQSQNEQNTTQVNHNQNKYSINSNQSNTNNNENENSQNINENENVIDQNLNENANDQNDMNQINNNSLEFKISVELNQLRLELNSDRYQTVPLFRFMIRQIVIVYGQDMKSIINCIFESIDFMDITHMTWKMLIEPFSFNINLTQQIFEETNQHNMLIEALIIDPININLAYNAIQLILKHSKNIAKMLSTKELYDTKPPYFRIHNKTDEKVRVNSDIEIKPRQMVDLNFARNEPIEFTIGRTTRTITADQLKYPIFFDHQTVISQSLSELGTFINISTVLIFENQTEYPLILLKQKGMKSFAKLIEIFPSEQKPMIITDDLGRSQFAIVTNEFVPLNISHETFDIKTIKKRAILLESYINQEKKYKLVISSKFDPLTCSMTVKIEPNCLIRNQLPINLVVRAAGSSAILFIQEGEKLKTTTIDTTTGQFYCHFATRNFSEVPDEETRRSHRNSIHMTGPLKMTNRTLIKTTDGSLSSVTLTFLASSSDSVDLSSITQIAIEAKINPRKPQINLVCYAPSIVFNRSGFDILCVNGKGNEMTQMVKFAPREKDSNPCEDGFLIWSNDQFFKKKENERRLPLHLFTTEQVERELCYQNKGDNKNNSDIYISDDCIECTISHINGPVMIPTSRPDLFVPLHYTVSSSEPYSKSKIVTITSQCRIRNMTKKSFYIQPVIPIEHDTKKPINTEHSELGSENELENIGQNNCDKWKFGDLVEIKSNSVHRITLASISLLFAFRTEENSENYTILNFSEPIHTTFALDSSKFEIENQALGVEMLITLKDAIFPQPLNFFNDLEFDSPEIYVTQSNSNVYKNIAVPQSMSIIAYDNPFGGTDIKLHYKNESIPINMVAVNAPMKYQDIYYILIANKNNTKTLMVSRKPYLEETTNTKDQITINIDIPVISISIIDKFDHEFALLTLEKLNFLYSIGELSTMEFKMWAFQLDDLQASSMLKVVAAGYPEVKENENVQLKNLVDFKISMCPDAPMFTACKEISLKIDPIVLFLDLSFVSDAIVLMQSMFIQKLSSSLLSKPKPVEPSSLSSIPLTAESLTINEIQFTLFVRSKTPRPTLYPTLSTWLKAVPDITNGEIILPSFHFEDCTMNAAYIQKEIVSPLIDAAIQQGLKMFFHTDIFMRSTGTRSASFAHRGERLMNGELKVLVQVPGSIILQGGEAVTNVASKLVHMATFDNSSTVNRVNTTAKDTMKSGMKALGNGFLDGLTGIVKTPMQMHEERGVSGVFIGIGKGLIGLVTKPVAGILDAGVASFAAMRKAINNEDEDVIPPLRCAHALPMMDFPDYSPEMYAIKDVAQLSFQMSDIERYYNECVEMYIVDRGKSKWIGVTQNYVFVTNWNGIVESSNKIRMILSVDSDVNSNVVRLCIDGIRRQSLVIHARDPDEAQRFSLMINSRRIALNIGE